MKAKKTVLEKWEQIILKVEKQRVEAEKELIKEKERSVLLNKKLDAIVNRHGLNDKTKLTYNDSIFIDNDYQKELEELISKKDVVPYFQYEDNLLYLRKKTWKSIEKGQILSAQNNLISEAYKIINP